MSEILFKGLKVEHILQKGLKSSSIRIKGTLEPQIILKTPRVSSSYVTELLTQKESWILKHLQKLEQTKKAPLNLQDEVDIFGERVSVDTVEALSLLLQKIKTEDESKILKAYDRFYKELAQKYLPQRVEHFTSLMQLSYKEIRLKKMRSRWGSCSSKRDITFNTMLLKLDKELIDYVVVHELAHLVHMNHSKAFHDLVAFYLPDSLKLRKKLRSIHLS